MQNGSPVKIAAKWLQPGVLMGVAVRLMCFAVLQGTPAIVAPSIQDTGSNALRMWDRAQKEAIHIGNHASEVYDNVRFVYQVARQLREMERESEPARLETKVIPVVGRSSAKKLTLDQGRSRFPAQFQGFGCKKLIG
jgi:hypothetical protein